MRQRTLIALAILAAAAGFLVLAAAYDSDWLVDLDVEVAGWMRDAPGWLTDAARVLGAFGGYIVLPLAVVVAVVLSLRAGRVDDALFVVIVALGADILVHGGRELHEPTRIDAQGLPDESRFPAGDATTSVAIWGALALLASRGRSRGRRIGIVATGLALGLVVAATRVVLDEQALSDVLAGALLGGLWLLVCALALAGLGDRKVSPAAAVGIVAAGLFVLLSLTYDEAPIEGVDEEVARWVAAELPAWAEWIARVFSLVGGWIGVVVGGVVMGVVLLRERAWLDLGFLVAAFAGSQLVGAALKLVFDRPRPDLGSAIPLPHSAAFPSGHAVAGTACVGALAILLTERIESRARRVAVWVGAVVLGLGIGLSRIGLGVHWLSDVVAGWAFGIAWLALCLLARDTIRCRRGTVDAIG